MSSIPVSIPIHAIAGRTLRRWTIDSEDFVGGVLRPARALPYTEPVDGGQLLRLASKLTRVQSDLERRIR